MNGRNHLILNTATTPIIMYECQKHGILPTETAFIATTMLTSYVGCLLPDIDHPMSYAGQIFKPVSKFLWWLHCKIEHIPSGSYWEHRWFTHDPLFVFIVMWWIYNCHSTLWLPLMGLFLGYISHLIGDALGPRGIWFTPFYRRFHLVPEKLRNNVRTDEGMNRYTNRVFWILILSTIIYEKSSVWMPYVHGFIQNIL